MPAKRVIAYVSCGSCAKQIPLAGVVTQITCPSCQWHGALAPSDWSWVLDDDDHTERRGSKVLGVKQPAHVACGACHTALPDVAVEHALGTQASAVPCVKCGVPTPLTAFPGGMEQPAAWGSSHFSAVLGESSRPKQAAAPLNFPCSSCGAPLTVDGSTPTPTCSFCGTRTALPPELWRELHPTGDDQAFYLWMSPQAAHAVAAAKHAQLEPRLNTFDTKPKSSFGWNWVWVLIPIASIGIPVFFGIWDAAHPKQNFVAIGGECSDKVACSTDKRFMLHCIGGKWQSVLSCRGAKGCRPTDHGHSISCDYSYANVSDPCDVNDSACSTDRKAELSCVGGKFVVSNTCRGPGGCKETPENDGFTLSCDDHVAKVGDPCKHDDWACSTNFKALLRCEGTRFALKSPCRGPKACRVIPNRVSDTTTISCDGNVADVGDPCDADHTACRADRKALLRCRNGRFYSAQACRQGCVITNSDNPLCR
jgi:hypothetical protein